MCIIVMPFVYCLQLLLKMHKTPYKSRFIAGSKNCTTKPVSSLLTRCFQCIKSKEEKYCSTIFNNWGINRMWILKNSPTLLSTIKSNNLKKVDYISTWDFSTLYNTIQHDQLKSRICRLSGSHLVMVIITILMCLAIEHSFLSNLIKKTWLCSMDSNGIYTSLHLFYR